MRRSAGKMFIRGLLESFFIVAILLGAGILGYRLTMHAWMAPEQEAVTAYQEDTIQSSITEPSVDDISKNLIFSYDDDTKEITKVVLEIFHCRKHKLTYITIPMRTQLTISDHLYRSMVVVNPEIPQVMQLSAMSGYLDFDTEFDYGVLVLKDLLGIDISYYTAIPQSLFDTMFQEEEGQPVLTFTDDYSKQVKKLTTKDKVKSYIEKLYPSLQSNLTVEEKMNYLDSYAETSYKDISFALIKGEDQNSAFIIDKIAEAQQVSELTSPD